jgi:pSer/pThr/pTyr-binding forkhead associated (FHA) protein
MSSNALALSTASETRWTVIAGPMRGHVRTMNSPAFAVGRSSDCEFVVLNDPNCSRKHAQIQWSDQGYEVVSLNEANLVVLNGRPVPRARLSDGDVLVFGSTEVVFNLTTLPSVGPSGVPSLHAVPSMPASMPPGYPPSPYARPDFGRPDYAQRPHRSAARQAPPKGKGKLITIVVVAALLFWFFSQDSKKKKAALKLRTEQQITEDIETANKLKEAADSARIKKVDMSLTGRQAQENYVRGFRDYRKGQYERALESFQACLALNPQHSLCNLYTRLASRKFSELVQYHIVLGRKYRDQNQFRACRASFRNVMVMVKDANSASYKEAKANYEACNSLMEGHY